MKLKYKNTLIKVKPIIAYKSSVLTKLRALFYFLHLFRNLAACKSLSFCLYVCKKRKYS